MRVRMMSLLMAIVLIVSSAVLSADAAQVVNYQVYAVVGGTTAANSSTSMGSSSSSSAYSRVYGSTPYASGGYSVAIPASSVGGYLIVAGYYPIVSGVNGSGWFSPTTYSFLVPFYFISTRIDTVKASSSTISGIGAMPFSGIVYIPPHSGTLYLNVYGMLPGENSATNYYGAYKLQGATIQFVPDDTSSSGGSQQVVEQLQQVNQNIQNIYNEMQSSSEDNQYADELLDQLDQLMDSIDNLTQQIEDNTSRPPPEDIVPSIPPVLISPPDAPSQDGRTAISDILGSSVVTSFLIMVFSLAFLRYVLYGKSK